jgi:hypothetical protein
MGRYVEVYVDDDDYLAEADTDDLIAELERRAADYNTQGVDGDEMRRVLQKIYENRRVGKDYQTELDQLIYGVLGKIV